MRVGPRAADCPWPCWLFDVELETQATAPRASFVKEPNVRTVILALSLICCFVFLPSLASATIVLSDDFSTNGALVGQSPDVGTGVWTQIGTNSLSPLTVTSNALPVSAGSNFQDAGAQFSASVPNTAGTSVFSGLDINLSVAQATGDYFSHLSDPALSTSGFYQRLFARSATGGYQLGLLETSGGTTTWGTTVLSLSQKYRVAIAWNFVSGTTNDTFSLYVDPTSATEGSNTPYLTHTWTSATAEPANVSSGNFRQGSGTTGPTLTADNLIVATTFAEASGVAIPEPTAILFGTLVCGVIGLGVGGRRLKNRLFGRD